MIKVNQHTTQREFITNAVIKSISGSDRFNSKNTPWRIATAEIKYPNGTTAVVGASLFTAYLEANPEAFKVGNSVELAIQLDGEYAGNAKMQLPQLNKADVALLLADEVTTTT